MLIYGTERLALKLKAIKKQFLNFFRKANVSKAEDAIMVEIKRKEEEGEVFLPLKTENSNFSISKL